MDLYWHYEDKEGKQVQFASYKKAEKFLKQVHTRDVDPMQMFSAKSKGNKAESKESTAESKETTVAADANEKTAGVGYSILDFPKGQADQNNLKSSFNPPSRGLSKA